MNKNLFMFPFIFFKIFVILFACSFVQAEPSPFGITIKKTTMKEIEAKYEYQNAGINKYSNGKMYDLVPSQFEFEGLKSIRIVFDKDEKVFAVFTEVAEYKYNDLYNMLAKKYKLIAKNDAFVGDKDAEFEDDQTRIFLAAPHMSFELYLNYLHNDFFELYKTQSLKEKKEKAEKESGQL